MDDQEARREKMRAYQREYYERNKERLQAYKRDYYNRTKDEYRERAKKWVAAHPDKVRENQRRQYLKVREWIKAGREAMEREQRDQGQRGED